MTNLSMIRRQQPSLSSSPRLRPVKNIAQQSAHAHKKGTKQLYPTSTALTVGPLSSLIQLSHTIGTPSYGRMPVRLMQILWMPVASIQLRPCGSECRQLTQKRPCLVPTASLLKTSVKAKLATVGSWPLPRHSLRRRAAWSRSS